MIERWRALAATPGTLLTAVATFGIGIGLNATLFAIMFPSAARTQKDLLRARKTSPISASDAYQIAQHSEWFRDAFAACLASGVIAAVSFGIRAKAACEPLRSGNALARVWGIMQEAL